MAEPTALDNKMYRGERACAPSPQTPRPHSPVRAAKSSLIHRPCRWNKSNFLSVVLPPRSPENGVAAAGATNGHGAPERAKEAL